METLIKIIQDKDYSTTDIQDGVIEIFVDNDWNQIYKIKYQKSHELVCEVAGDHLNPAYSDIDMTILVESVILIKQCNNQEIPIPFSEKLGEVLLFEFDKRL